MAAVTVDTAVGYRQASCLRDLQFCDPRQLLDFDSNRGVDVRFGLALVCHRDRELASGAPAPVGSSAEDLGEVSKEREPPERHLRRVGVIHSMQRRPFRPARCGWRLRR